MSLTKRDGVINTQTNCWTKQGQWGQGCAVNTIPGVSLPGLRRRMQTQQLTALSHKKGINLEGFFHCQLSAMPLPVPSVAKVKRHHVFLFWPGYFLFLFSFYTPSSKNPLSPLVMPPYDPATCLAGAPTHVMNLLGIISCLAWWQEHGVGAQPRAVCCQTD